MTRIVSEETVAMRRVGSQKPLIILFVEELTPVSYQFYIFEIVNATITGMFFGDIVIGNQMLQGTNHSNIFKCHDGSKEQVIINLQRG